VRLQCGTRLVWLGLCLLATSAAGAEAEPGAWVPVREGTLYEIGSNRKTVLLRWSYAASADGQQARMAFVTPAGVPVTTEQLVLEDGEFREYAVVHHEAGQEGRVRRVGDRVEFSYTRDGGTETSREDYTSNFVAGAGIRTYIQAHWAEIQAGDTLKIRMPVPDRLQSLEFKLWKDSTRKTERGEAVVVKMRPASFLLAALVDPVYFTFSEDGQDIWELNGRMSPIRKIDGELRPTEVDAVFHPAPN
jgi:hypothetical protein